VITINDVKLLNLRKFIEPDGNLVPIEAGHDIPFDIKRIFYVYGVNNQNDRGKHSHHKTKQVLICLSGEVEVVCDDGVNVKKYKLTTPNQAIYIPEMIWDEQRYMSKDSVLLVLSNTHYDSKDYIEDYDEFLKVRKNNK
jgi:mannose-6-phosphate isomerase-like protein (cupin superfamily)